MSSDITEALGGEFDASAVEQQRGFDPIPAGWYAVEIDKAMVKDTKAGTGKYLKLELVVLDEPHEGRRLFININLSNPNPQAVEIGQRELAGLSLACGITALRDSAELLQKQIGVKVKIKTEEGREPDNYVVAYRSLDGAAPAAAAKPAPKPAAPAAKPAPKAGPQAPTKRPWER